MNVFELEAIFTASARLVTIAILSMLVSAMIAGIYSAVSSNRFKKPENRRRAYWLRFVHALSSITLLAFIGALSGQLGGSSRDSVVGDLLPAVFTLLGGYLGYLIEQKKDRRAKIAVNAFGFLFCFFFAYNVSATWRQSNENWEFCKSVYANPDFESDAQRQDRDHRFGAFCGTVFSEWTQP